MVVVNGCEWGGVVGLNDWKCSPLVSFEPETLYLNAFMQSTIFLITYQVDFQLLYFKKLNCIGLQPGSQYTLSFLNIGMYLVLTCILVCFEWAELITDWKQTKHSWDKIFHLSFQCKEENRVSNNFNEISQHWNLTSLCYQFVTLSYLCLFIHVF